MHVRYGLPLLLLPFVSNSGLYTCKSLYIYKYNCVCVFFFVFFFNSETSIICFKRSLVKAGYCSYMVVGPLMSDRAGLSML